MDRNTVHQKTLQCSTTQLLRLHQEMLVINSSLKLFVYYRVIQKECKIVHAYFKGLGFTLGGQMGGRILLMPEHFENMHIIEQYSF